MIQLHGGMGYLHIKRIDIYAVVRIQLNNFLITEELNVHSMIIVTSHS